MMERKGILPCQTIACFLPDEKEEKAYGTQKDGKRGHFQDA